MNYKAEDIVIVKKPDGDGTYDYPGWTSNHDKYNGKKMLICDNGCALQDCHVYALKNLDGSRIVCGNFNKKWLIPEGVKYITVRVVEEFKEEE